MSAQQFAHIAPQTEGASRFVNTLGKSYKLLCHELEELLCQSVMHVLPKCKLIHLNIILWQALH